MKLSKTEKKIIEMARSESKNRFNVEMTYGQGPQGGRISFGNRMFNATKKLIDKGILKEVFDSSGKRYRTTFYKNGYCVHSVIISAVLLETPENV